MTFQFVNAGVAFIIAFMLLFIQVTYVRLKLASCTVEATVVMASPVSIKGMEKMISSVY